MFLYLFSSLGNFLPKLLSVNTAGISLSRSCSACAVLGLRGPSVFPGDPLSLGRRADSSLAGLPPSLFVRLFFPWDSWGSKGVNPFFALVLSGPFHPLPSSGHRLLVVSQVSVSDVDLSPALLHSRPVIVPDRRLALPVCQQLRCPAFQIPLSTLTASPCSEPSPTVPRCLQCPPGCPCAVLFPIILQVAAGVIFLRPGEHVRLFKSPSLD